MQKQVSDLLQKEVTRKEFMTTLGFGVASVVGLGSVVKLLGGKSFGQTSHAASGYGSSVYGGNKAQ